MEAARTTVCFSQTDQRGHDNDCEQDLFMMKFLEPTHVGNEVACAWAKGRLP